MNSTGRTTTSASAPTFDAARVSLLWAVPAHAPGIAELHGRLFPAAWDEAAINGMLAHPGSVALVASHGNPAVIGGFALAQAAADEAEILTMGVSPDWQRKGIGRRLVDGLARGAARAGAKSLFLEVAQTNASAQALYASAGFREAGRRKGYYKLADGTAVDAIVMRCAVG